MKAIGSIGRVGRLEMSVRLKFCETVILPSILYNIETVVHLTPKEVKGLESLQADNLSRVLGIPRNTSYMGMLMETWFLTMQSRVEYKKLMLIHNILHSDEKRIIKQIVRIEKEVRREGTWYTEAEEIIKKR